MESYLKYKALTDKSVSLEKLSPDLSERVMELLPRLILLDNSEI